jgi:hypothetical protein
VTFRVTLRDAPATGYDGIVCFRQSLVKLYVLPVPPRSDRPRAHAQSRLAPFHATFRNVTQRSGTDTGNKNIRCNLSRDGWVSPSVDQAADMGTHVAHQSCTFPPSSLAIR